MDRTAAPSRQYRTVLRRGLVPVASEGCCDWVTRTDPFVSDRDAANHLSVDQSNQEHKLQAENGRRKRSYYWVLSISSRRADANTSL